VPRYRANLRFGPWNRGDVFESTDPMHARMAQEGRLLEEVDGPSAGQPAQVGAEEAPPAGG
jgi:hypothetical protein